MPKRSSALALLVFLAADPGVAWGPRGHQVINRVAIAALPSDAPAFLRNYADWIAERSTVPDSWRLPSEPFLKIDEDPNHGWFKEQFAFLKTIPRSRYEFVLALYDEYLRIKDKDPERGRFTNVRWTGTLPYAAVETYERIKVGMRQYRAAATAGRDTGNIERDIAFCVGWLGHYTGDGAQPLHDSIHHDGWLGLNPANYTREPSIHGRFETAFVDLIEVSPADVAPRLGKARVYPDAFDAILAHLDKAASHVEEIYGLDLAGAFSDKQSKQGRELVVERLASGAELLRDLVWQAWIESGQPLRRPAGGNPIDFRNPNYNPATGSAPAPR
ncbi:MAG: nuclease [Bryobacteraceae bacterium]